MCFVLFFFICYPTWFPLVLSFLRFVWTFSSAKSVDAFRCLIPVSFYYLFWCLMHISESAVQFLAPFQQWRLVSLGQNFGPTKRFLDSTRCLRFCGGNSQIQEWAMNKKEQERQRNLHPFFFFFLPMATWRFLQTFHLQFQSGQMSPSCTWGASSAKKKNTNTAKSLLRHTWVLLCSLGWLIAFN